MCSKPDEKEVSQLWAYTENSDRELKYCTCKDTIVS